MAGRTTCLPDLDNYIWRGGTAGFNHRDLEKLPAAIPAPGDPGPREHLTVHDGDLSSQVPSEYRLKYPDVSVYPHVCGCESVCPCVPPCYLQCFHVVCASLCFLVLYRLYESCGILCCVCLCVCHVFSLCLCVFVSALSACSRVVSVLSACVFA